jgi:hypothetical protein
MPVAEAREAVLAAGITINGLPIMIHPPLSYLALDRYYASCVIGGPSAFMLPVKDQEEFAEAIRRKLVLEIADSGALVPIPVQATPPPECLFY